MNCTRKARGSAIAALAAVALIACADSDAPPDGAGGPDTIPMVMPADTGVATPGTADAPLADPNTANEEVLGSLPGLDSTAVDLILQERPFDDMLALHRLLSEHADSATLDGLYRRMFIPLDLNAASREEILLIPGVGPRMAGEFLEYRPYRGMEEFRREIGKYVDEAEVARLERYVTLEPQP